MRRLLWTLAAVLGVFLVAGAAGFALRQATTTAAHAATTTTTVPFRSTNKAPSGSTTPQGATAAIFPGLPVLTTALDNALAGTNSCLSVQSGTGQVLYQHQPAAPLIPASTQKLLVAEAALTTLGPNYRFITSVVAPAAPVNATVAKLWLVGAGDPLLALPQYIAANATRARMAGYPWTPLSALAEAVTAAGVRSVTGGIAGDDSDEDQLRVLPVWPASYQSQEQIGELSALSVNEGVQYVGPKTSLATDPPGYAAAALAGMLTADGVAVAPAPDEAAPTGAVVLATVASAPLSQIVETMLRASDDWIAELLVRAIDKETGGAGTTAGGTALVMGDAARAGIPMAGVQMVDGSGLSRDDRATCPELLAALDLGDRPPYQPILDGLAVAAQTGTLADRFQGSPLAGALRAKTGSLDDVGGLVGTVTTASTVRFAFLENDPASETAMYTRQDAVAAALYAFSQVP